MTVFSEQWNAITEGSPFAEEAVLRLKGRDGAFAVKGFFCSGTYDAEEAASRGPKRYVQREQFMLCLSTLPPMARPWDELKEAELELRGRRFRVKDASGKDGGTITLELIALLPASQKGADS